MIWLFNSDRSLRCCRIAACRSHCCQVPPRSFWPNVGRNRARRSWRCLCTKKKGAYLCRMCAPMSSSFHNFVTHSLSHTTFTRTIFHTQLCHTLSFTQLSHTPSFTHNFVTHHLSLSHTIFHIQLCQTQFFLLFDPSPPPLSFLPSPSRYNMLLIIGISWLVGLSGPLIYISLSMRLFIYLFIHLFN